VFALVLPAAGSPWACFPSPPKLSCSTNRRPVWHTAFRSDADRQQNVLYEPNSLLPRRLELLNAIGARPKGAAFGHPVGKSSTRTTPSRATRCPRPTGRPPPGRQRHACGPSRCPPPNIRFCPPSHAVGRP